MQNTMPAVSMRGATALWVGALALAGFLLSYALVDRLTLPRNAFVLGHLLVTGALLAGYAAWSGLRARDLVGRWRMGLAGGVLAGALLVGFVLRGPSSPAPDAWVLAGAVLWVGLAYGTIDALFLSVFPVLEARRLLGEPLPPQAPNTKAGFALGLALSLALTAAYHFGFPEFGGAAFVSPLIGNTIVTLSYLATRSVVTPVFAHVCLHVAAVTFGLASAIPTPPHY